MIYHSALSAAVCKALLGKLPLYLFHDLSKGKPQAKSRTIIIDKQEPGFLDFIEVNIIPNFKQHALIGAGAGAGVYLLSYLKKKREDSEMQFDLGKFLIHTAFGCIAASVPDLLEPATSPNHRNVFHSIAAVSLIIWLVYKVENSQIDPELNSMLSSAGLGYVSHLLADSTTPKGLPIL